MLDTDNNTQELSPEEQAKLFKAIADNAQARADYAASRADLINPLLFHESTIRAIFDQETVSAGDSVRYDVPFEDIECVWVMPNIGAVPFVQVEAKEFYVNTFGLEGGVEFQMDVVRDGRVRIGELATTLLMNNFIKQEELSGWSLIKTHAAVLPSNQKVTAFDDEGKLVGPGKLNIHTISEAITVADELGVGGRRITDIYVSPRRFADLRNQVVMQGLPDELKSQAWGARSGEANGVTPEIRFHKVYNRALVSDNKAYAFTQKEGFRYGVMPIRDKLQTYDNPISILEWKIGIMGRERLGFGVLDDKGLIEITFGEGNGS